jgi:hypothetical protein
MLIILVGGWKKTLMLSSGILKVTCSKAIFTQDSLIIFNLKKVIDSLNP